MVKRGDVEEIIITIISGEDDVLIIEWNDESVLTKLLNRKE